jgi:hypothetical protein
MFNGPMIKRFVRVQVMLDPNCLAVEGEGPTPIGYFQLIGCTAREERDLDAQVRMYVAEDLGGTIIDVEVLGEPDFARLEEGIRETISADPEKVGIWYTGGHAMYAKDDASS